MMFLKPIYFLKKTCASCSYLLADYLPTEYDPIPSVYLHSLWKEEIINIHQSKRELIQICLKSYKEDFT